MKDTFYITTVTKVDWRFPCEKPEAGKKIMIEHLDGSNYILDPIANFDAFGDAVVRWAYV